MATQFVSAPDGARIAYDVSGSGPALLLLHGSGQSRLDWHTAGYVKRLQESWKVIAVDTRGSGESEMLTDAHDYTIEKLCADLISVADACNAQRFAVCGYSFGGGIAGYLAAGQDQVGALVVIGAPLSGPALDGESGRFIEGFLQKYGPLAASYNAGQLSAEERAEAVRRRIPMWVARFQAIRTWPDVTPAAIRCPVLLVAGTANEQVYRLVEASHAALTAAKTRLEILDGLSHEQEFSRVDQVCPLIGSFLEQHWGARA